MSSLHVATAPTVYGIETRKKSITQLPRHLELQQHLPFTVLKLPMFEKLENKLKESCNSTYRLRY